MRRLLLIAAVAAFTPAAYVEAADVSTTTTYSSGSSAGMSQGVSAAPSPENCGTPYEAKACPPLPRVPLQHFPGDR
jgi:hypothetical protein